ncbi:MAG: cytosine permease, partial [Bacteroidales bacterium]|nr:cytosine permease [Bacteroidales bacterium]
MSNKKITDVDYTTSPVDAAGRKSNLSMFMVMLGFTFFSASMWVGQQLAAGLDWWGFVWALILGGIILAAYTGTLGWIGAESGLSLDMLARRSFGTKGSWLPSAMISFTQTGWFGVGLAMFAIPVAKELMGLDVTPDSMPWQGYLLVAIAGILMTASAYFGIKSLTIISYIAVPAVAILGTVAMIMAVKHGDAGLIEQFAKGSKDLGIIAGAGLVVGSFVSGGTATPNFTRFAKSGKVGLWITVVAFFIGNSLMFLFGAVSSIYVGGNDIFEVMLNLNLFYLAVLVLGLNIWTTNDNALYTAGLGLSNIFGLSKKTWVIISGLIGTVAAVWLYWNFCDWLNVLNCTLPPVGI